MRYGHWRAIELGDDPKIGNVFGFGGVAHRCPVLLSASMADHEKAGLSQR